MVDALFEVLKTANKDVYTKGIEYFMERFGTKLPCNRFALGNLNETLIVNMLKSEGLTVNRLANESRVDAEIETFGKISIKYSGSGNVKLHNSNNSLNKDMKMVDTLLVTPTDWWLLLRSEIERCGIKLELYLKNTNDGLTLKRSILTELKKRNYRFTFNHPINMNKKSCKNEEIGDIIANFILSEIHV